MVCSGKSPNQNSIICQRAAPRRATEAAKEKPLFAGRAPGPGAAVYALVCHISVKAPRNRPTGTALCRRAQAPYRCCCSPRRRWQLDVACDVSYISSFL